MSKAGAPQAASPERHIATRVVMIMWPAFFSAGVATMLFFAFVDPLALRDITFPDLQISREFGYTLAFLMFWLATSASSLFTWILMRTPCNRRQPPTDP